MELLEIAGFAAAVVIGVSLGLIGGGGSILTVPVLVYMMGVEPVLATSYSLFVVGISSLVGSVTKAKRGLVDFKTAAVFAVPSFIAVFLTRLYLVPAVPETIFSTENFVLSKSVAIMVFFALIMLAAAYSMMKSKRIEDETTSKIAKFNYPVIILEGAVVGVLTGIVGAGGGFLIIPALVLLAKLPMKIAVGTSLVIIAAKSLIGFTGDIAAARHIDYTFLMIFSALAIAGIFLGGYLSNYVSGSKLKKGFGWFVLAMAVFIIVKELVL